MNDKTLDVIKQRRSVREFKSDALPDEIINAILDCGRLSPSARNMQPWHFVAVTDPEIRAKIAYAAVNGKFIAEAPLCILVFCLKDSKRRIEDGSAATQNMLIAARSLGVGTCWIAGVNTPYEEEVGAIVGAPSEYGLISIIAAGIGIRDSSPTKKALAEVASYNKF